MDSLLDNTTYLNGTNIDPIPLKRETNIYATIALVCLSSIICLGGFWGNLVVSIIVLRRKKMQTPTNWFVFNLAISDLAITLITIPLWIVVIIVPVSWPFGSVGCKYLVMPIMEHFTGVCVLTHTAVGVARYIIVKNSKSRRTISNSQVKKTIAFIWIVAFFFLSAPLMGFLGGFKLVLKHNKLYCKIFWVSPAKKYVYRICAFILTYVIPMVATGFSYCKIHEIVADSLKCLNGHISAEMLSSRRRQNRQLNKILMTMYVLFAITTLPLQLFFFLFSFSLIPIHHSTILSMNLLFVLFYAQVVTNPLVLFYMGENYRKEIYNLPLCCCVSEPRFREISLMVKGSFKGMGKGYNQRKSVASSIVEDSYRRSSSLYSRKFRRSASKRNTSDSIKMNKSINLISVEDDASKIPYHRKSIQNHFTVKEDWRSSSNGDTKGLLNGEQFKYANNRKDDDNVKHDDIFELAPKTSNSHVTHNGAQSANQSNCVIDDDKLLDNCTNNDEVISEVSSSDKMDMIINLFAPIPIAFKESPENLESILYGGHHETIRGLHSQNTYKHIDDEVSNIHKSTRETII